MPGGDGRYHEPIVTGTAGVAHWLTVAACSCWPGVLPGWCPSLSAVTYLDCYSYGEVSVMHRSMAEQPDHSTMDT